MTGPRPLYTAVHAATIAKSLVGTGEYILGTGDMDTPRDGRSDCAGFAICKCYGLRRHRAGFNRDWKSDARYPNGASVVDDLNVNAAIEDADHWRELFVRVQGAPRVGDLLCYPTFHLPGRERPWIGHVGIVTGISRLLEWDSARPTWSYLDVVQCRGPDETRPGIVATTGAHWDDHDRTWPKAEHRSVLLRVVP